MQTLKWAAALLRALANAIDPLPAPTPAPKPEPQDGGPPNPPRPV